MSLPLDPRVPLPTSGRHIRLATLHPATDLKAPINVELSVHDFDADLPEYSAVSYVWGKTMTTINCDGHEFDVSSALEHALRRIRSNEQHRLLWIDQLCIRQADAAEKSRQIPLMGEIYRRAPGGVIGWLGGERGPRDGRIDIRTLMKYLAFITGQAFWTQDAAAASDDPLDFTKSADRIRGWRALVKLLNRTWFKRVWIVQEAAAQKDKFTFYLGHVTFSFRALFTAVDLTNQLMTHTSASEGKGESHPAGKTAYFTILRRLPAMASVSHHGIHTMQDLVQTFCTWSSSEPRDMLYGLLPLASDANLYPAPDYSLPVQKVYRQYAEVWLRSGLDNVMSALSFAAHNMPNLASDGREFAFPSWVTDWQSFGSSVYPARNNFSFAAGQHGHAKGEYMFDGEHLHLNGAHVDRVARVGSDFDASAKWFSEARDFLRAAASPTNKGDPSLAESLARVLVMDGGSSLFELNGDEHDHLKTLSALDNDWNIAKIKHPAFRSSHRRRNNYTGVGSEYQALGINNRDINRGDPSIWPQLESTPPDPSDSSISAAVRKYRDNVFAMMYERCLFLTDRGRVGIAGGWVRQGDSVTVFEGARMPFILRKSSDDDNIHRLVSEVFVRGIMHGESIANIERLPQIAIG